MVMADGMDILAENSWDELSVQQKILAEEKKESGNSLYKLKDYRQALSFYSEAINLNSECSSYYGNRAACYMMLTQYKQALVDAQSVVRLDPNCIKGYLRVAKCCCSLGDLLTAQRAIDQAYELDSSNSNVELEHNKVKALKVWKLEADKAYSKKDYRRAVYCLDNFLNVASACTQVKLLRAESLCLIGRFIEAQQIANDIIRTESEVNTDAIYVRGLCLYYDDQLDLSISHFRKALQLDPNHTKAKDTFYLAKSLLTKKNEGNEAFKAGKLLDAYNLYKEALMIDPNNKISNAKIYGNKATTSTKLKKFEDSIQDATSALNLNPLYTKAFLLRGNAYLQLSQFQEAVNDYDTLHKADSSNSQYRQLLQKAQLELKKSKRKNYYKILGVEKTAHDYEIKKAYRKLALLHHPDRHSNASPAEKMEHEKMFKDVGEAYDVLLDSKKRSNYDNGHDLEDLHCDHNGAAGGSIDPNQIFRAFFDQSGSGATGQGFSYSTSARPGSSFHFQF